MCVYPEVDGVAGFEKSRAVFEKMMARIASPEVLKDDLATTEEEVLRQSRALSRQVLEDVTRRRAELETPRDVLGSDGVERTHHRGATREVESIFGTISFTRDRVGARGQESLVPVDSVLNLTMDRFSFVTAHPTPSPAESLAV